MKRLRALSLVLVCLATASASWGCNNKLFPEDAPRTPYDRYQAFRGESRQQVTTDAFGREKPDLRARLAPLSP